MKKKILFTLLLMLANLVFATTSWIETGSVRLSNQELIEFYENKTMIAIHSKYGPLNVYFGPNGHAQLGKHEFDGSWWIDKKENNVCVEVNVNKKIFCHYTVKNTDGTHTIWHSRKEKPLVEIKSALEGNKLYLDLTAKE